MRRPSRFLSALLSSVLAVSALALTSVATAAPAQAAPGDPFPAADPLVFVAQGRPTGLFKAVTNSSGVVSFQAEGPTSPANYNAIAYNTADNYLYGIVGGGNNATYPNFSLVRIGQNGVLTRVGTGAYMAPTAGNAATFGADGLLYISNSAVGFTTLQGINVTTGAIARTVTLSQPMLSPDFTYANGYFWGVPMSAPSQIARINPANGVVDFYPAPFIDAGGTDFAGAAWTFGNGNLGFSQNVSGTVSQVSVTNPSAATPTFTLVSRTTGPASGNNDGASSPGQPTDLSITKDGPVVLNRGGTVTYTLMVTNNGPGNSSGFTVSDAVPAPLTGVASSTAGCTVAGNTVTCVGGQLPVGTSAQITITANVPANLTVAVTNTATVTANESDPTTANNSSSTTGNPVGVSVVKHAATPVDANADGIVDAGDTILYTFTVTNTGLLPLNAVSVSDPKIGPVTCPAAPLAAAATVTCTAGAAYTITAADVTAGAVDNSATASGTPQGSTTPITSTPSTTHTPTTAPAPALSIVKSASPSDAASFVAGQVVTYSFVVSNTGNVPLTGVTIDDSDFSGTGTLGAVDCPPALTPLDPSEQVTCTASYTLTQADVDAGEVTNSATASGTPTGGGTTITTPPSSALIPVAAAPAISLVKSADPATANAAGDTITYLFRVTNTGNVTVSDPTIDETAFSGTGAAPVVSCPTVDLTPGEFATCTAGYQLTQADVNAGTVTNTATASATASSGADPTSAPSSAAVSIAPAAALTVVKSSTVNGTVRAGGTVTYSFLVTNTGNGTIDNVAVTEGTFSGTGTLGPITCPATTLEPTEATTCTADYALTQADVDAGTLTNSATATGTPPGGGTPPVSPPSENITPLTRTADLAIVKSATPTTIAAAGEPVSYSFLITNTGNVTLTDPVVDETAFSGTGTIPIAGCPAGTVLAPTDTVICTASYTATQADVDAGSITNTATASATPPAGVTTPVSDPSSAAVTASAAPALTVVKSADLATITKAGQKVTYSFLVTNTGNVTMANIAIDEGTFSGTGTLPAVVCPQPTLAPGAHETCTTVYTVTQADVDAGTLTNTATATGTPPGSTSVVPSPPSTSTVTADQTPALSVVKSAAPAAPADFHAGEVITYSFVVTNTGNVTLSDVTIEEGTFTGSGTLPAPTCPAGAASLAPGAQVVCTTTYTVTQADIDAGEITNSATALGTPPGSIVTVPSDPSTVTVPEPAAPAATVVKTSDTTKITQAGQVIHYSFTVTNTGNTSLSDPKVNEGAFTGHGKLTTPVCPTTPATLLPGQTIVCTASYTVVAADLTGQALSNTATVSAIPPGGDPVTSDPSSARITDVAAPAPKPADPLASTGSTIGWGIGATALALLLAGSALLLIRRRRATE